jgi:hypothetical protein
MKIDFVSPCIALYRLKSFKAIQPKKLIISIVRSLYIFNCIAVSLYTKVTSGSNLYTRVHDHAIIIRVKKFIYVCCFRRYSDTKHLKALCPKG